MTRSRPSASSATRPDQRPTRTLLRGLAVLEFVATSKSRDLGVSEIAQGVGLDRATTLRLLATLCEAGFLVQDSQQRNYQVSSKLVRLAGRFGVDDDIKAVARPGLSRLRDVFDETVHLGVIEGDEVVYVDKQESSQSIRLVSAIGQRMPLNTTALGKAILGSMDEDSRDALLERITYVSHTSRSITDPEAFREELALTRRRGFAIDDAENENGVTCAAASIRLSNGQVVAAISVSGPTERMEPNIERVGEQCRRVAAEIGDALAGDVPP